MNTTEHRKFSDKPLYTLLRLNLEDVQAIETALYVYWKHVYEGAYDSDHTLAERERIASCYRRFDRILNTVTFYEE